MKLVVVEIALAGTVFTCVAVWICDPSVNSWSFNFWKAAPGLRNHGAVFRCI